MPLGPVPGKPAARQQRPSRRGRGLRARPRTGFALAGGGPFGAIYEIGALIALQESLEGIDLNDLDVYVGVSAGSFLAAALANGSASTRSTGSSSTATRREGALTPEVFMRPAFREYLQRARSVPPLLARVALAVRAAAPSRAARWNPSRPSDGRSPPASSTTTRFTGTCTPSSPSPAARTISASSSAASTSWRPTWTAAKA